MVSDFTTAFHAVILRGILFFIVFIFMCMQQDYKKGERRGMLIVVTHILVYCVVFALDIKADHIVDTAFYNNWQRILWIHFGIVILTEQIYRLRRDKLILGSCNKNEQY
jgi:hypothetical protein